MDTTDNNEAPKRRIEDQAQAAKLDWTKPDAPAVPAASSAPGRIPLRAVASMCVKPDDVSFFATPAAKLLEPGHYMLSVQGAAIVCTDAGAAPAAGAASQAQPVATFGGYDGETLKPLFTLIGTPNAGDKLCVCAPAQAAAPSDVKTWQERLPTDAALSYNYTHVAAMKAEIADLRAQLLRQLAAQLLRQLAAPAAIPEGWKLVPVDLTPEMLAAADRLPDVFSTGDEYRVMLAAAPAHPAMPALLDHAHAEPSKITDTESARRFVDAWHREHFPTDRTFSRYILGWGDDYQLAGDFAWQLAKALEAGEVSQGAAPTAADVRDAALEEAAQRCESAELLFDVDELMRATKKELTAITATKLVGEIRALKRAAQPNIQEAGNA